MIIPCDSCNAPALEIEWEGCSADVNLELTKKKALVICGACLDKVPDQDITAFFRHLTLEKSLTQEKEAAKKA